jgi:uncharacterized protein YuzE
MKIFGLTSGTAVILAAVLGYLPQDEEDRGRAGDGPPPRDGIFQLLDTDENGEISLKEIEAAAAILKKRDRNGDGVLTPNELPRPPRPGDGQRNRPDDRAAEGRGGPDQRGPDQRGPNQGGPDPQGAGFGRSRQRPAAEESSDLEAGSVLFRGGYDTDRRDNGRPVNLIAAALGVSSNVFREAFSRVQPARGGAPTAARAQANKRVLMQALGKHGITSDRLDAVSNYYRYQPERDDLWRHTPATATAVIKNGKVVEIKIENAGSGYSVAPQVRVVGYDDIKLKASVGFSKDLAKNGQVTSIEIVK